MESLITKDLDIFHKAIFDKHKDLVEAIEQGVVDIHDPEIELTDAGINAYKILSVILNTCDKDECSQCAVMLCPVHHPLHLHHDGCPGCMGYDRPELDS